MKKTTGFLSVIALLLVIFMLIGCSKPVGDFSVNQKIVCEVDGETVTYDEYKYFFFNHYVSIYGDDFTELTEEKFDRIKALTEDSLRKRAYILELCDEYGIKLSKEDKEKVDYYVGEEIKKLGGEAEYKKELLKNRVTGAVFRSLVELEYFYDPYLQELLETGIDHRIPMTDEAIFSAVQNGEFYHYQYHYFELTAGKNSNDLKAEAEEFYADVLSGKKSLGNENYDIIGQRTVGFENAVLALDEGEMSEVLWADDWSSNAGYYILKRLPIDVEQAKANREIYEIEDEYFAKHYLDYISKQSKEIEIEYARYFEKNVTFKMLLMEEKLEEK